MGASIISEGCTITFPVEPRPIDSRIIMSFSDKLEDTLVDEASIKNLFPTFSHCNMFKYTAHLVLGQEVAKHDLLQLN